MKASRTARARLLIAASLLTCLIGCDQATKSIATKHLLNTPRKSYLHDTVRFDYALNPGGFLSLGGTLSPEVRQWVFIGLNTCMLLGVASVLAFYRRLTLAAFVCLTLILAGGIGNLIDRISNDGLVTDFIILGMGPVSTGVFNVADIAVTAGGILAFYLSMFGTVTQPTDHDPMVKTI